MTIKLTKPQGDLLSELKAAGTRGVFKSLSYDPARILVRENLAFWRDKYFGGTGTLVVTDAGEKFGGGK